MVAPLFLVELTFSIRGRGRVLLPGVDASFWPARELPLLLRRPDGSELRAVGSVEHAHGMIDGRVVHHYPVLLPVEMLDEEIPSGTEVFDDRRIDLSR